MKAILNIHNVIDYFDFDVIDGDISKFEDWIKSFGDEPTDIFGTNDGNQPYNFGIHLKQSKEHYMYVDFNKDYILRYPDGIYVTMNITVFNERYTKL